MREIIRFDHVRMAFGEKEIFSDLSLSFSTSGQYAILGPSGRGKTTLLRLIAGLEKPRSGTITISQNTRICFCFQEDRLLPWKTVLENVALVCDPETAGYWLDQVGLSGEENNYPASLSGGMKRRASLARALDDATHTKMLALVREAAKDKLLILVTHDEADADGMEIVRI